jgi:hypothetical protein
MLLDEAIQAGTDIELPIAVRATKKGAVVPASDFVAADFTLFTMDGATALTKTLGSGIAVEDIDGESLFVITLEDTDTLTMQGLFQISLVVEDSAGIISMPVHNEITLKPRLGV